MEDSIHLPPHSQLLLPLLEVIKDGGGAMGASDACDALAEKLGLPDHIRSATREVGGQANVNLWARRVRWVRQTAIKTSLLDGETRGVWALTERGDSSLMECQPGVCIVVYETASGQMLWADAHTAAGVLDDNSVQLLLTSPPYPLLKAKKYGNLRGDEYLRWMCDFLEVAKRALRDDGSMVINLMDCQAESGNPALSLYKERLLIHLVDNVGMHLCQNFFWNNPNKIPNGQWVTVKKVRCNPEVEHIFWLSKTPHPKVRQSSVLTPYSESMKRMLARGGEKRRKIRPSGHGHGGKGFAVDRGGAIPGNLITAVNAESNGLYHRFCRRHDLPAHPARFPAAIPDFFIDLLTDKEDLVWDPFGGSNRTGSRAEAKGRRWVCNDRSLVYAAGSVGNFSEK